MTAQVNTDQLMRKALLEIKELKAKLQVSEQARHEPIAVIGMGCRFPGAENLSEFWQLLHNGIDAIREIPPERFDYHPVYDPTPGAVGKMYTRYGGFLRQFDQFDPAFFGISPREANDLDPQHRLLLEVTWEAMEHAGVVPTTLIDRQVGVFVGISTRDYEQIYTSQGLESLTTYFGTGNAYSTASGRLSYLFGFQGPCISVDTACSSSLVGTHLAVQSLRNRECNMALAGGVNRIFRPEALVYFSQGRMMSPEGRCKTFDAAANGYVRSEGCGMIVLKRLSDALAAGDTILALIRGSATNQDGRSSGLTAPNGPSQEAVIRQALTNGNLTPADVSYMEAHGTGTSLGDPIEVESMGNVFGDRTEPLWIGSVKSNIGHLEASSGVAGVIKVILAMQHGEIPGNLHFNTPSPHIDWANLPVRVPTAPTPWLPANDTQRPRHKRIAGVNSFAFSGSNAHVVLEEWQEASNNLPPAPCHLLTLSAKSEQALQALATRYLQHVEEEPNLNLADLCYSTSVGRTHFSQRCTFVAASREELTRQLVAVSNGITSPGVAQASITDLQASHKIAFLFTGQGSQYVEMGRQLYESQPIFRAALDRCDTILHPLMCESILNVIFATQNADLVHQTQYTQPILFALEYALAELWKAWGITPDFVLGHSVGEIAAACFAGVFSLEDGLKLIAARGRLMQTLPQDGTMVALLAEESQVQLLLAPYAKDVSIAAINGPQNVVISGRRTIIKRIVDQLSGQGIKCTPLTVSHAFHSPLMEPMLAEFAQVAQSITYHTPRIPLVSNVTGKLNSGVSIGREIAGKLPNDPLTDWRYWVRHVRDAVRFADGVQTLQQQGVEIFLEIGPKPVLLGMVQQTLDKGVKRQEDTKTKKQADKGHDGSASPLLLPSLRVGRSDMQQILESLAELHVHGVKVDWSGFYSNAPRRKIHLPTYPFQRSRFWIDPPKPGARNLTALGPLLDKMVKLPLHRATLFEVETSTERLPFLADHVVHSRVVSPAACHLATVASAGLLMRKDSVPQLSDVLFTQPLIVSEGEKRTAQVIVTPEPENSDGNSLYNFQLLSFAENAANEGDEPPLTIHASGQLSWVQSAPAQVDLTSIQQRCTEVRSSQSAIEHLASWQIMLGPTFHWLNELWVSQLNEYGEREALGRLTKPEAVESIQGYLLHPGFLDSCFHVGTGVMASANPDESFLPFALHSMRVYAAADAASPAGNEWWCHARQVGEKRCDFTIIDGQGQVIAELQGMEMRRVQPEMILGANAWNDWLYQPAWEVQPESVSKTVIETSDTLGTWLLFADSTGVGSALADLLRQRGEQAICVFAGDQYSQSSANTYHIAPDSAGDYQRLLQIISPIHKVVYLWGLRTGSVSDRPAPVAYASGSEASGSEVCGSVLHLLQNLLQQSNSTPSLAMITSGAQAVVEGEYIPGVAQSPLWGMGNVIALEHPELACTRIDVDPMLPPQESAAALMAVLTEPQAQNLEQGDEDQLALRKVDQQVQRYVRRLTTYKAQTGENLAIHADGTYLITGGLGGLGLQMAQWLVSQGARHLLLVGRSQPKATAQAQLAEMEAAGASITIAQADVADRTQVAALLAKITPELPLRGIIHAAGLLEDATLRNQSWERFARVLAPKVQGAWHLHELTQNAALDFFVLFSSVTSLLGNAGQANYAAANAFLDALAHHRRALGLPALSLNWAGWSEVGMAAELVKQMGSRQHASGLGSISPQQGLKIFAQLLGQPTAQVGVLPIHWSNLLEQRTPTPAFLAHFVHKARRTQPSSAPQQTDFLQLLTDAPTYEWRDLLLEHLQKQVAAIVGTTQPPAPHVGFAELGMDSLMSVELKKRLENSLRTKLASTLVFEYPTIEALSTYLFDNVLKARVEQTASSTNTLTKQSSPTINGLNHSNGTNGSNGHHAALPLEGLDDQVAKELLELEALLNN